MRWFIGDGRERREEMKGVRLLLFVGEGDNVTSCLLYYPLYLFHSMIVMESETSEVSSDCPKWIMASLPLQTNSQDTETRQAARATLPPKDNITNS